MHKLITIAAAALLFLPALAHGQAVQTARTYQGQDGASKEALGTFCVPDTTGNGCPTGGSGGAATPTGTAGSPNPAVVTVQGVSGGTPQPSIVTNSITVGSSVLPTGAATQATLATLAATNGATTDSASVATDGTAATQVALLKGIVARLLAPTPAGSNTIGTVLLQRVLPFAPESTAALAASASFTGAARDSGVAPGTTQLWGSFRCFVRSDQAGTVIVDGSTDAAFTAPVPLISGTVAATTGNTGGTTAATPLFYRYNRCRLVNGATANTAAPVIVAQFGG